MSRLVAPTLRNGLTWNPPLCNAAGESVDYLGNVIAGGAKYTTTSISKALLVKWFWRVRKWRVLSGNVAVAYTSGDPVFRPGRPDSSESLTYSFSGAGEVPVMVLPADFSTALSDERQLLTVAPYCPIGVLLTQFIHPSDPVTPSSWDDRINLADAYGGFDLSASQEIDRDYEGSFDPYPFDEERAAFGFTVDPSRLAQGAALEYGTEGTEGGARYHLPDVGVGGYGLRASYYFGGFFPEGAFSISLVERPSFVINDAGNEGDGYHPYDENSRTNLGAVGSLTIDGVSFVLYASTTYHVAYTLLTSPGDEGHPSYSATPDFAMTGTCSSANLSIEPAAYWGYDGLYDESTGNRVA